PVTELPFENCPSFVADGLIERRPNAYSQVTPAETHIHEAPFIRFAFPLRRRGGARLFELNDLQRHCSYSSA
ncbi:MAG TPA: hypothetical protein VKB36_15920, partial [Vicinamibacterales bacterium]|nr:hypothetical protein [Vicinamibacterales bacterium]